MNILWVSDAPTAPSGFGNVTRFVCDGLSSMGHTVSILGWQIHGSPQRWRNCTLYPVKHDGFGADVLLSYLQRIQPDVLITLADVWWLTFITNPHIAGFMRIAGIPWALYYPIDGDLGNGKLPPSWIPILKAVNLPIAMAKYGKEVSEANGIACQYIPHGVETSVFAPPADKAAAKAELGYQGKFVIMSDARNQPRKMHPRSLDIFKKFAKGKPDVLLHLHCDKNDPAAKVPEYWYNIVADVEAMGLVDKIRFTQDMNVDKGLSLDKLRMVYQAADVHLLSSWGEGFGLPTLQAASAGVIPMACDYTASRELTTGHGEPLPIVHTIPDQFGILRALVDIDATVDRLDALYSSPELLARKSAESRAFALGYDWAPIVRQWDTLLRKHVPSLKEQIKRMSGSKSVEVRSGVARGASDIMRALTHAGVHLPQGVNVKLSVVSQKAGELMSNVYRDALSIDRSLMIPATLASRDPAVKKRETGSVFIAGPADTDLIRQLATIFPGLRVWSSQNLSLGLGSVSKMPVTITGIPYDTPAFKKQLASTTFIIDCDALYPDLRATAARLWVPCMGPAWCAEQHSLWPDLCTPPVSEPDRLRLVRTVLLDQHWYETLCARAEQTLVETTLMNEQAAGVFCGH